VFIYNDADKILYILKENGFIQSIKGYCPENINVIKNFIFITFLRRKPIVLSYDKNKNKIVEVTHDFIEAESTFSNIVLEGQELLFYYDRRDPSIVTLYEIKCDSDTCEFKNFKTKNLSTKNEDIKNWLISGKNIYTKRNNSIVKHDSNFNPTEINYKINIKDVIFILNDFRLVNIKAFLSKSNDKIEFEYIILDSDLVKLHTIKYEESAYCEKKNQHKLLIFEKYVISQNLCEVNDDIEYTMKIYELSEEEVVDRRRKLK
jgi:hypothetical protein